ncbi:MULTISPECIES: hypothetical protein [unclassified Paenibacillus]|nr:hypothetical protein [Paenibacillus sp. SZ31]
MLCKLFKNIDFDKLDIAVYVDLLVELSYGMIQIVDGHEEI